MVLKTNTNIETIIAKIDNDFNPDNSDWIPRVAAWCIEAMQMLDVLPTERIKKTIAVKDRIAYSNCDIGGKNLKVYDSNGNEIKETGKAQCSCNSTSTGEKVLCETSITPDTIDAVVRDVEHSDIGSHAEIVNTKDWPGRYNVFNYKVSNKNKVNNYVIIACNKLELNFDTDSIIVEYDGIVTQPSEVYGCELPIIPNNGILIEALGYYCMYKMLCRGYKHPVFNLHASQYGTNPYYQWTQLKEEAKRSVINGNIDDTSHLFRSNFFIQTFDSRH